eukprot:TRINITY_DN26873_c0_g1_i1.p1 TRINITY_DN26873_c0_g1~~TRINITY_DN26873_c0_g1_i1.p1  ORF type:complete len:111 (+),score=6.94 TRINITY_DN26873_c0_g1_i1:520-852(+)
MVQPHLLPPLKLLDHVGPGTFTTSFSGTLCGAVCWPPRTRSWETEPVGAQHACIKHWLRLPRHREFLECVLTVRRPDADAQADIAQPCSFRLGVPCVGMGVRQSLQPRAS